MPPCKIKLSALTKFLPLYTSIILLLTLLLALAIYLPYFATHIYPRPSPQSPPEILLYIALWILAISPSLFFAAFFVAACYYSKAWHRDLRMFREQREYARRVRNMRSPYITNSRFVEQEDDKEKPIPADVVMELVREQLRRPERVERRKDGIKEAWRFGGVKEGVRRLGEQVAWGLGKGKGNCKGKAREEELWTEFWDAEKEFELSARVRSVMSEVERGGVGMGESSSRAWWEDGFEDVDLGRRVRVMQMV